MAIKSSGQLSLRDDIQAEIGGASENISLRAMSVLAGFVSPDAMSEFYGYSAVTEQFAFIGGQIFGGPDGQGVPGDPLRFTMGANGDGQDSQAYWQFIGPDIGVHEIFIGGPSQTALNSLDVTFSIYQSTGGANGPWEYIGAIGRFQGATNTFFVDWGDNPYMRTEFDIQRGRENRFYSMDFFIETEFVGGELPTE